MFVVDRLRRQRRSCATTRPASARSSASTRITKFDYLFGRFLGAFLVAGARLPRGPARHAGRLADAVGRPRDARAATGSPIMPAPISCCRAAQHPALTGASSSRWRPSTRSMMATYLGVVAFLIGYLVMHQRRRCAASPSIARLLALRRAVRPRRLSRRRPATGRRPSATRCCRRSRRRCCCATGCSGSAVAPGFLGLAYLALPLRRHGRRRKRKRAQAGASRAAEAARDRAAAPAPAAGGRATARAAACAQLAARTALRDAAGVHEPGLHRADRCSACSTRVGALWFGGDLFGTPTYPVTVGD